MGRNLYFDRSTAEYLVEVLEVIDDDRAYRIEAWLREMFGMGPPSVEPAAPRTEAPARRRQQE